MTVDLACLEHRAEHMPPGAKVVKHTALAHRFRVKWEGRSPRGAFSTVDDAMAQAWRDHDRGRRTAMKKRPCITCSAEFYSEGPHHRMCDRCRRAAREVL